MPKITKIDENTFEVTVIEMVETTHKVIVSDDYYNALTGGHVSKERLLEEAFNYLLNRESNAEIMKEFELKVIEQYFPGFPAEIRNRFM